MFLIEVDGGDIQREDAKRPRNGQRSERDLRPGDIRGVGAEVMCSRQQIGEGHDRGYAGTSPCDLVAKALALGMVRLDEECGTDHDRSDEKEVLSPEKDETIECARREILPGRP